MTTINSDGSVQIAWQAPDDNSEHITHYEVEIADTTGLLTFPQLAYCSDEKTEDQICSIPMLTLVSTPFSLQFDQLVSAKVRAVNMYGKGDWSSLNTVGARIR